MITDPSNASINIKNIDISSINLKQNKKISKNGR